MEKIPRERVDKFAERRAELSAAALLTLADLGYARTSLREIAQNSVFSHGVLHYYFQDKQDLILCSIRQYKAGCVTRYDDGTNSARNVAELMHNFVTSLAETVVNDWRMHRLWYDLRAQALFEDAFREDVMAIDKTLESMVWRVIVRFSELSGQPIRFAPHIIYATLDGLFQQCLLHHQAGDTTAIAELQDNVRQVIEDLFDLPVMAQALAG